NLTGYNDVIGNQVIQNAVQNPRVQNIRNQNRLIGVQWNGNQNQIRNGNLVAARAEGNVAGQNGKQIRCYNCRGVIQNAVQNPRVQNIGNQNGLIGVQWNGNQNQIRNGNLVAARAEGNVAGQNGKQIRCYNCRGVGHYARNCTIMPRRKDAAYLQTQLLIAQKEEAGIQLQAEEYDLMAIAEILKKLRNAPVYDLDGSAENDNNVIFEDTSVEQGGETVEQHPTNFKETRALYESLYQNLAIEVEKVNSVNRKLKETNADLTTELARFKNKQVLLEKHDPPVVHDSKETLQLAQESREKMKQLNKEIKPANYTKINHLSGVFVPQTAMSREELYFSNNSKTANVSKLISIPNDDFSDDTTPSVARKFLNEVKSTIVTLQRAIKHRMTIETHNWSSSAHQELHKIVRDEIFPIVNQVDARVQNFEIQLLKEAAKFVGDFKSLANEADASLSKHKALELEIKRLFKLVVNQDIMTIVQKESVVDTLDLQTELERTKERFENCIIKKENEYAKLWNDWYKKSQLGDLKGKSKDTSCVSDTRNPLSQKLENENVELEFQVSDQKDNTHDTSANTKFAKQPIMENLPKVGKTNALSKPVTSNLVSTPQESKGVDNTKTKRPQPRSNTKHDRVPSASKSSRSKNKEAEVEEHHRNLLLFKNNKHISSACINIKIDSQDVISKVVCAMCKKCLISVNHDECLHNYVNGKKSHGRKHKANVSFKENQKKYQPKVTKPKKVGILERLATPKPKKPRFLLRWS
nr:hypothetical protein [Tanacetum cinerariifolium]